MVAALIGMTVSPTIADVARPVPRSGGSRDAITPGGIEAARWIRAHSSPDDVIATNVHCFEIARPPCTTASFWIPGYAERRTLVQGWAYTARANAAPTLDAAVRGPFWDQDLLRRNDAAFTRPTSAGLAWLRDRHGVRWLFLDDRLGRPPATLSSLASLRLHVGNVWVYALSSVDG